MLNFFWLAKKFYMESMGITISMHNMYVEFGGKKGTYLESIFLRNHKSAIKTIGHGLKRQNIPSSPSRS